MHRVKIVVGNVPEFSAESPKIRELFPQLLLIIMIKRLRLSLAGTSIVYSTVLLFVRKTFFISM